MRCSKKVWLSERTRDRVRINQSKMSCGSCFGWFPEGEFNLPREVYHFLSAHGNGWITRKELRKIANFLLYYFIIEKQNGNGRNGKRCRRRYKRLTSRQSECLWNLLASATRETWDTFYVAHGYRRSTKAPTELKQKTRIFSPDYCGRKKLENDGRNIERKQRRYLYLSIVGNKIHFPRMLSPYTFRSHFCPAPPSNIKNNWATVPIEARGNENYLNYTLRRSRVLTRVHLAISCSRHERRVEINDWYFR